MKSLKDFNNEAIPKSQLNVVFGGEKAAYEDNTSWTQGEVSGCDIAGFNECGEMIYIYSTGVQ